MYSPRIKELTKEIHWETDDLSQMQLPKWTVRLTYSGKNGDRKPIEPNSIQFDQISPAGFGRESCKARVRGDRKLRSLITSTWTVTMIKDHGIQPTEDAQAQIPVIPGI